MTGRDLLSRARETVAGVSAAEVAKALDGPKAPAILDVREADEVATGRLPGAVTIPRSFLELRAEAAIPPERPVIVYCASGTRSLLAGRTLLDMGYGAVRSLDGGIEAWKAGGFPVETPPQLSADERRRYARHLLLSEVGEEGQLRIRKSRVLLIGAGGLGSPAALYLAAAGVGTLGLVDDDVVDVSNLQRQILHRTEDEGVQKIQSAVRAVTELNPDVATEAFPVRFSADTAEDILGQGWDVVVDGTDLIPARYVINDACAVAGVPLVHGAIHRFEGQVAVFHPGGGHPCYRCLFPEMPPPEATPSCAEAGVVGTLPGVIGTLQAMEALKVVLGAGDPLFGTLLRYEALPGRFESLRFPRDPDCSTCGLPS
ncbi:MAG: molybdopterin-synthase adenylyltransferase MoeB [Myxococcota bacterium]